MDKAVEEQKGGAIISAERGDDPTAEFHIPRSMFLVTATAALAVIVLLVGALVYPSLFWEKILWPYMWGPVVADSTGSAVEGIKEGYNIFNTVIYALILVLGLYWCYALLRKLKVEVGWKFILAVSPFVALGGTARALEDANLFSTPTSYIFIAPLIYIFIASLVICGLLLTWLFYEKISLRLKNIDRGAIVLIFDMILVGIIGSIFIGGLVVTSNVKPIWVLPIACISFLVGTSPFFRGVDGGKPYVSVMAANSTFFLLLSIVYIGRWMSSPWIPGIDVKPFEALIIPGMAIIATILVILVFSFLAKKEKLSQLKEIVIPTSIMIWVGHMLDASATYRGISAFGYVEKHVLAKTLIDISGTALVMFAMKLAVIGAVIYILEVQAKEEIKDRTMMGLIRLAIFILGFAPGLRDLLRIVMGV